MKLIKCKECTLLDKCPSGKRCVAFIGNFERFCPCGYIDNHAEEGEHCESSD